jgi:D-alanine-D-alanine ligase
MGTEVLVLYNAPFLEAEDPTFKESVRGVDAEVAAVRGALKQLGIRFRLAGARSVRDLDALLKSGREQVVVNLVEALDGLDEHACLVPDICRSYGRSVTGNTTSCLSLTLDKIFTKAVLSARGIPTPWWIQVSVDEPIPSIPQDCFPVIVKPSRSDASEGIDAGSVLGESGPRLEDLVRRLHRTTGKPVLIERYLEGREFNVALMEDSGSVRLLPPSEIVFTGFPPGKPKIVDYAAKWLEGSFEYCNTERLIPAQLSDSEFEEIRDLSLHSWQACGCRDYARVDLRMGSDGHCSVLEINANPDIAPDAGFAAALEAGKIDYAEFVSTILQNAGTRVTRPNPGSLRDSSNQNGIFRTREGEIEAIVSLVAETGFFRPDEVTIAAEVLDGSVHRGEYESYTFLVDGVAAGWVCFGPTPCTMGTYDIYWLAVSPQHQGRGLGKELMAFAENWIRQAGGRIAVVETAGRPDYEPTRRFYDRIGYALEHRIIDFYAPGDDKMIYCKRF